MKKVLNALLGHCNAKGDNSIQRTSDVWHAPIGFFGRLAVVTLSLNTMMKFDSVDRLTSIASDKDMMFCLNLFSAAQRPRTIFVIWTHTVRRRCAALMGFGEFGAQVLMIIKNVDRVSQDN